MESARPYGVIAEMPRLPGLHDVVGFASPSAGPLVITVVSSRSPRGRPDDRAGVAVGVFDAAGGQRLAWWRTGVNLTGGVVAFHVYESGDGPILVLAPDRHPVRQWLLPRGEPVGPAIDPGGNCRAVDSYRDAGQTVLVIADAKGRLCRYDATTGAPLGQPVRFGATEPARGLMSRLARRAAPAAPTFPGSLAIDTSTGTPRFVTTDRQGALWRGSFEDEPATSIPLDAPGPIWFVRPDPTARQDVLLVAGLGFAGLCDTMTGRFVTPPARYVSDPASEEPDGAGAALIGDELHIFVAVDGGLLRFTAGQECGPHRLFTTDEHCGPHRLLGPGNGMNDDDQLESLCLLPVGERTAIFAADQCHLYRLDAATGQPWPAEPSG